MVCHGTRRTESIVLESRSWSLRKPGLFVSKSTRLLGLILEVVHEEAHGEKVVTAEWISCINRDYIHITFDLSMLESVIKH